MSRPVIVGVDPLRSEPAPLALASLLARLTGASVLAVAAYPHDAVRPEGSELEAALRDQAWEALERAAAELPESAKVRAVPAESPARALQEAAERESAAMLVVGSAHGGPLGRLAVGSVADRILHGSPCPVAVAPLGFEPPAEGVRRIAAAFVDTPEGRAALAKAAELAGLAGATLQAVTIVQWFDPTGMTGLSEQLLEDERRLAAELADRAAEHAVGRVAGDIDVRVDVIPGGTAKSLVERSREFDLMVCGSRGYGPLRSVLLGSVSRALAHHAHCPLLVVPRAHAEEAPPS
jgi:nucleotide-binding universal stress UspA family protein